MQINELQSKWSRSFELVKFSCHGEVSNENATLFQGSTDDFKKMELIFLDQSCNLMGSYNKIIEFGYSTDKLLVQLSCVDDDIDSNIQVLFISFLFF